MIPSEVRAEGDAASTEKQVDEHSEILSTALESDEAIYFQGDCIRAAKAVLEGKFILDKVSFFVGASCWSAGQLETEVERGWWMPCAGPPQMALTGTCNNGKDVEGQDMWLSMMAAIGEEEAKLAYLMREDKLDENSDACDEF